MTLLWIILMCLLAVVWVITVVDIFRRHHSAWTTVGWLALIVVLPFVGSLIYWTMRKPTREETDQAYIAEAELRHETGTRPFDRTGKIL